MSSPNLSKCPKCGGPADNGHDRCLPPAPYFCTKCQSNDQPNDPKDIERGIGSIPPIPVADAFTDAPRLLVLTQDWGRDLARRLKEAEALAKGTIESGILVAEGQRNRIIYLTDDLNRLRAQADALAEALEDHRHDFDGPHNECAKCALLSSYREGR